MTNQKTDTQIHEKCFDGRTQTESTRERETLVTANAANHLELCNKSLQAITEALAELKSNP